MRAIARSLGVVLLALIGAVALALSATMTTVAQLLATALIMGGTGNPNPQEPYLSDMSDNYIEPGFGATTPQSVFTPAEFFPVNGTKTFDESVALGVVSLEDEIANTPGEKVVLGYSQSTRIATINKRNLIAEHEDDFDAYPDLSYVMVSNVNKPNGGILQRLEPFGGVPFAGITFDGATPTNSPENPDVEGDYALDTKDVTIVHDGYSDFPEDPTNVLAVANAIAGIYYLHGTYPTLDDPELIYQGTEGDTDYYVIGTDIVPILMPLEDIGVPRPILLVLDEPTRVLIETAYRRDVSPGTPTPIGLVFNNPITVVVNLATSVPVGIDDALEDPSIGIGRALGTQPSGPFGVGGWDGPAPTTSLTAADERSSAPEPEPNLTAAPQAADPPATEPPTTETDTKADPVVAVETDETDESDSTPVATRPRPVRPLVRLPIGSDLPKPRAIRPSGDRPLKKVIDALTGQRPTDDTSDTADAPKSETGGAEGAA